MKVESLVLEWKIKHPKELAHETLVREIFELKGHLRDDIELQRLVVEDIELKGHLREDIELQRLVVEDIERLEKRLKLLYRMLDKMHKTWSQQYALCEAKNKELEEKREDAEFELVIR